MPGALEVRLGSTLVGTLTNLPGDYNVFAFEQSYLDDPLRPVLSQAFLTAAADPIRIVPRTHTVAPPFFANLLPDPDALLRSIIARQQKINLGPDFPFLRALGRDLPGAIVLEYPGGVDEPAEPAPFVDESVERPLRFSLAGLQLKFSASMLAQRLTIPITGRGGSWIVKIPTNTFPRLPENEHAIMALAELVGLHVPKIALVPLDTVEGLPRDLPALRADEPRIAYVIERFDRGPDEHRVHFEDLNQVANQKPADKYENKATHWIANVIATLCPPEDLDEFIGRLVFGVCIGNNDMHLKNWAIAYPDGRNARIAPLYDFVCTRLYYPNGGLALTLAGERTFERIDRQAITALAKSAEISSKRALTVASEIVEKLRTVWPTYKTQIGDLELVCAIERNFDAVPLMRPAKRA